MNRNKNKNKNKNGKKEIRKQKQQQQQQQQQQKQKQIQTKTKSEQIGSYAGSQLGFLAARTQGPECNRTGILQSFFISFVFVPKHTRSLTQFFLVLSGSMSSNCVVAQARLPVGFSTRLPPFSSSKHRPCCAAFSSRTNWLLSLGACEPKVWLSLRVKFKSTSFSHQNFPLTFYIDLQQFAALGLSGSKCTQGTLSNFAKLSLVPSINMFTFFLVVPTTL